ncbi:MAG: GNAT family N-acetyltransferase [Chloroflexota bacterium]
MSEISVESFSRNSTRPWKTIQQRIGEIELECFGKQHAFSDAELRAGFNGRQSVAVLLWDGSSSGDGVLVGYTQAAPAEARDTYYIANTVIAKSHQGRGLVKLLMDRLYADVRAAGALFLERDAAIANGYADKVVCAHAAQILVTSDHDSPYGPQRFIRMRLPEP